MAKVLQMPKSERPQDASGLIKLPELLSSAQEEQKSGLSKINKWLDLADRALSDSDAPVAEILRYK